MDRQHKAPILKVAHRRTPITACLHANKSSKTAYSSKIISGRCKGVASVIVAAWPKIALKITLTLQMGCISVVFNKNARMISANKHAKMRCSKRSMTTLKSKCIIRTSMT